MISLMTWNQDIISSIFVNENLGAPLFPFLLLHLGVRASFIFETINYFNNRINFTIEKHNTIKLQPRQWFFVFEHLQIIMLKNECAKFGFQSHAW